MPEASPFLDALSKSLADKGFEVKRGMGLEPYMLDLVAARSAFELSKFGKMTRFVVGATFSALDSNTVNDFSSRATKFALDNRGSILPRGFGGSVLVVPVLVADEVPDDLKKWVADNPTPKHWAAFEFPVLVSLRESQTYYCKKTPVWGAAYYGGFRKFAESNVRFQTDG